MVVSHHIGAENQTQILCKNISVLNLLAIYLPCLPPTHTILKFNNAMCLETALFILYISLRFSEHFLILILPYFILKLFNFAFLIISVCLEVLCMDVCT